MSWRAIACLSVWLLAFGACTFDEQANQARGCDERCAPGACYLGYCLSHLDSPAGGVQDGASGVGPGSSGAASGGDGAAGATSSGGTATSGSGAAPPGSGSGGASGPPSCAMPMVETCNGVDDDCDGALDEDATVTCYPTGVTGCALDASGAYACTGLCATGTQACTNGSLGACVGAVQPSDEQCGGTEARDEDCDGTVDDDCPCTGDETQRCYSGRAFSAGIGICKSGTQQCVNGLFGACEGEVTPTTESCANPGHDDDCDFFVDDVTGAGATCFAFGRLGVCSTGQRVCDGGALVCRTPEAEADESACDGRDEDCDGAVDENFDLGDDPDHCGACGVHCGADQLCCDGSCRDAKTDPQNCGVCGHSCGSDACCSGACVATDTVKHCGGCSPCEGGEACCGGSCVATDTSDHCGGCDACNDDQLCCGGDCVGSSGDGGLACP